MRPLDWMGTAAAVLLFAACSVDAAAQETLSVPADWGPNLLAAKNGCQVQKAVNQITQGKNPEVEFGPANLIDGDIAEGRPYSAWDLRKEPGLLVLQLAAPAQITRFVLLNDSSKNASRGAKSISIAVSSDGQQWQDVQACTLGQAPGMQSFELTEPVAASSVQLTIKDGYTPGFAVLEEFAAFGTGSPAPADSPGAGVAPVPSVPSVPAGPEIFRGTEEHDVMELRNGDVLTGKMLNETLQVQTSYAKISFRYEELASLVLDKGLANIDLITVLNGDVFAGYLLDRTIKFQLSTGPQIDVRREKIGRLGIQIRATEEAEYPSHDVIVLKNGIKFSGVVKVPEVTVQTSYATVPTKTSDIALIEFINGDRAITKVTLKNKDTMQGQLLEEDIAIDLDFGPEIVIYKDKIATITFQE
ncbi:MAG: discoidin domain-containing protein [Planctomycetota bacterium]